MTRLYMLNEEVPLRSRKIVYSSGILSSELAELEAREPWSPIKVRGRVRVRARAN